jgi:AcrR family transcriptional regulator
MTVQSSLRARGRKARGKTKKEVLSEFRCGEILEAARKVFAARGYSQTTVDDVAKAAQIAKGTVYLYFPSKRAVYLAALRQGVEALYIETSKRTEAADGIRNKLRAFVETRIRYFDEHRDFFKIYHSEFANIFVHPAGMDKDFRKLYAKHVALLRLLLEEAIRRGEVKPLPPERTAIAIYDMARGVIAQRLLGWSKVPPESDVQFIVDLVWKGIGTR